MMMALLDTVATRLGGLLSGDAAPATVPTGFPALLNAETGPTAPVPTDAVPRGLLADEGEAADGETAETKAAEAKGTDAPPQIALPWLVAQETPTPDRRPLDASHPVPPDVPTEAVSAADVAATLVPQPSQPEGVPDVATAPSAPLITPALAEAPAPEVPSPAPPSVLMRPADAAPSPPTTAPNEPTAVQPPARPLASVESAAPVPVETDALLATAPTPAAPVRAVALARGGERANGSPSAPHQAAPPPADATLPARPIEAERSALPLDRSVPTAPTSSFGRAVAGARPAPAPSAPAGLAADLSPSADANRPTPATSAVVAETEAAARPQTASVPLPTHRAPGATLDPTPPGASATNKPAGAPTNTPAEASADATPRSADEPAPPGQARASAPALIAPTPATAPSAVAAAVPAAVLLAADDETTDAADPTSIDVTDGGPDLAPGSGPSTPAGTRAVPPGATVPARLSPAAWLGSLDAANGRSVQVALGDDGTVRLRTDREGDGVTVRLMFSDPELQSLAGAHAGRLRDVLAEHFAEPVLLSLPDGSTAGDGAATGDGAAGHGTPSERGPAAPSAAAPDARPSSTRPLVAGRREWIG